MESVPLLYKIIFIVVINTVVISIVAYLLCRTKIKNMKGSISQAKLEKAEKTEQKDVKEQREKTETSKSYQGPVSTFKSKKQVKEEEQKESKRKKFRRYTPLGYIDLEDDRYKRTSKWR